MNRCKNCGGIRINPDESDLNKELLFLEESYFDLTPFLRKKELININTIRKQLKLPLVDINLREIAKKEDVIENIENKTTVVSKPYNPYEWASTIYNEYLDKTLDLKDQIRYADKVIQSTQPVGGRTPVEPLATMGTNGSPLLCDICHTEIPLEGGEFHKMPASAAWKKGKPKVSYILGGVIILQESNGTLRIYHGYETDANSCYKKSETLDNAARSEHKPNYPPYAHEQLRRFIDSWTTPLSEENRDILVNKIIATMYGYDPGVGINHV